MLAVNIGPWSWLLSVVIVGILVNLSAIYIKSYSDKVLSRVSVWYKMRTETQKRERLSRIEKLAQDPHGQILQGLAINEIQLSSLKFVIYSVMFILFAILTHQIIPDEISVNSATTWLVRIILFMAGTSLIVSANGTLKYYNETDILEKARESSIKQSSATSNSTEGATPEKPEP